MTTDKCHIPATAPMWWDGGDRAITAREKATIEEHGPSCFTIPLVPAIPAVRCGSCGDAIQPDAMLGTRCRCACSTEHQAGEVQGDALVPVQPRALAASIAELEALMEGECLDPLTTSESESVMLVLQELNRLQLVAARQPGVQEPVAVVVPGAPTSCKNCGGTDLEWFAHVRALNDVQQGRLNTHDVGCVFVLGCEECSETLHVVKADDIAALLNAAPPAQGIDLGQQEDAARWRWVREQNGVSVSVEEADDDGDMAFVSGHTPEELDAAIDGQRDAAPGLE